MPPESGLARAAARPRAAKMQFYYLFHLRSCAAATAGCCGSAYSGGSRTVFVPSLLETLFLNLFTSVFVYGFRILLLVALVLAFAFCASCVPTYVYLAAAPTINAVVLPLLDPDRGIRVKFFVQGKKCRRPDEFVPHGLTARQVLDRLGYAADVELIYPAGQRKYSDDEVVAAPVVVLYTRLRLQGGAPKKKRKKETPTKPRKVKACCCSVRGERCTNNTFVRLRSQC